MNPARFRRRYLRDMWSLSDEALLAGLASGEAQPAAAFVRRFQSRVYGLALAIVRDAPTAEEVTQETFIRAWRYAPAFDPSRGRVAPWLLRIARNAAVDAASLRRPVPIDPQAMLALPLRSAEPDPEERGVIAHDTGRLRRALDSLPDEQRRAVLLAGFHGQTAREIGEAEGIPLGTAKTRIRAAVLKLRSAMEIGDG